MTAIALFAVEGGDFLRAAGGALCGHSAGWLPCRMRTSSKTANGEGHTSASWQRNWRGERASEPHRIGLNSCAAGFWRDSYATASPRNPN